jgi:hypothetical protein
MRRAWAWAFLGLAAPEVARAQSFGGEQAEAVAPQQHPSPEPPPEGPHPWRLRPWSFDAVLGIASPWGLTGLSGDYAPVEHLSVGGGLGTNGFGWQVVGMARLRFTPARSNSIYFGFGYSQGRHIQSESTQDGVFSVLTGPWASMGHTSKRERTWSTARWLNVELGFERRYAGGLDLRGFVGGAFLLNPSAGPPDGSATDKSEVLDVRGIMIYAGTAVGIGM